MGEYIKRISFCLDYYMEITPSQVKKYFNNLKKTFEGNENIQNIKKYINKTNKKTYININLQNTIDDFEEFNEYVNKINKSLEIPNLKIYYNEGFFNKKEKPTNKYIYQPIYNSVEKFEFIIDED